jgi:Tol biopolymer transport system component
VTRGKGERNVFPRWSADGSSFYFYQLRPTVSFRQISTIDGKSSEIASGWEWRTHNGARVDPEGKRVIFTKRENRKVTTMVRDIETQRETVIEPPLRDPHLSRDGKSVVGFQRTAANWGNPIGDIVVCAVDLGTCRKVARNGSGPIWSSDESQIYFARQTSRDRMEIWSVSANGEDEKRVVELPHIDPISNFFDVSSTGQVVYIQFKPGKPELWMMDFK